MPFCFLTTYPKSGTYLMRYILGMVQPSIMMHIPLVRDDGCTTILRNRLYPAGFSGHFPFIAGLDDIAQAMPAFILLRDPRDVIVSWHHYIDKIERSSHLAVADRYTNYKDYDGDERKMALVETQHIRMRSFSPWLDTDIIPIHYEDLLTKPEVALVPVAEATDIDLDVLVERSRYRGGITFRKGVAGEWHKELNGDHIRRFGQLYEDIMDAWGYG